MTRACPRLRRPASPTAAAQRRLDGFGWRRGETLPLAEALAHSEVAIDDLANATAAAIERSSLPTRLREVLILRTLAQWNARAEWDVHALLYAPLAPLTLPEVEWLGGTDRAVVWSAKERLLIDLADHLRRDGTCPGNLWDALAHGFPEAECAEVAMIAGQYVKIALMTNMLGVPSLVPDGPAILAPKAKRS